MRNTPLDPGVFFAPYDQQMRSRAGRLAQGEPDDTRRAAFAAPNYYARPQTSSMTGASFPVGVADPASSAMSSSLGEAFSEPQSVGQREAMKATAHVVLEDAGGESLKQSLDLPYARHSIVDPIKAANLFSKKLFNAVFHENPWDKIARRGLDALDNMPGVHEYMGRAEKWAAGRQQALADHARRTPALDNYFQNAADSRHSFDDLRDLGKGFGALNADFAQLFGYETKGTVPASKVARAMLTGPVALGAFVGLNVFPLVSEIHHLYDKATGNNEAQRRAEEHHNLESPQARIIKSALGLPYKKHSEVDPAASANAGHLFGRTMDAVQTALHYDPFAAVREYFDRWSGDDHYPTLIGNTRRLIRSFYQMETSALEYFATHNNFLLSGVARALLYGERVQHTLDYSFKFSPTRFMSRMLRAAAGVEKRNYEHLAMAGISNIVDGVETDVEHLFERRFVKVAGIAIGLAETWLHYQHAHRELDEIKERFFGTGDSEVSRQVALSRQRRRQAREARRKGQRYDPTRPGRDQKPETEDWKKDVLQEFQEQLSPRAQLRAFRRVISNPKDNLPTLAMYGTIVGLTGHAFYTQFKANTADSLGLKLWQSAGKVAEHQAFRMQGGALASGLVGMITGRSWSARIGSFSNLLATLGVDKAGALAGRKIMETPWGRNLAAKVYSRLSDVPAFFEVKNTHILKWAEEKAEASRVLADSAIEGKAITGEERLLLKEASAAAERVGMEVVGIAAEGTVLIPIRHLLHKTGRSLDRHARISRAERRAKEGDKDKQSDLWLRRYLLSTSAPAFSAKDAMLNPDYDRVTRVMLLAARQSPDLAAALDAAGRIVTPIRRFRAGAHALRETRGGKRRHESWRDQLARSYVAPAYSDNDIASNPQYTPLERVMLATLKHTATGHDALEKLSPLETRRRRATAAVGGVLHQDGEGIGHHVAHVAHHAIRHHAGRGAKAAQEQVADLPGGKASLDLLHAGQHAVSKAADSVHVDRKVSKSKVKVRSNVRHHDAPVDERMLHTAYSRYLNYGSKGNTISYSDNNANS